MTGLLPLQSIGESGPFSGDALGWLFDTLVSAFGGPGLFGFLLSAVIFVAFYIASDGDLATPTVALVLIGTVTVGMIPAQYSQLAYGVVIMGLGAALWQVLVRYIL